MYIKHLQLSPYFLLAFLIFTILIYKGINLIFFSNEIASKDKRFIFFNIKNRMLKFDENAIEQEFLTAGFRVSFKKYYKGYKNIRYLIFIFIFVYLIVKVSIQSISITSVIIAVMLYLITAPNIKIGKKLTPFGHIIKYFDSDLKKKQDVELSSIIIQLQNIAVSQKNEPTTLSYMLSRIVRFSKYTKTAFIKMISYIDQGKEEQARDSFIDEIDTSLSRDLAYILIQLDRIEPIEVVNQMKMLEERVRNENLTNKNHKEEFYSNLMYIIPTTLCFVILMNFLNIILNMIMNFKI